MTLLYACLAMALKDGLGVVLMVSEARGRAIVAGTADALGDIANVLVTVFAAGTIIVHGWTVHSLGILAAVCATSFLGTVCWTKLANKWMPET